MPTYLPIIIAFGLAFGLRLVLARVTSLPKPSHRVRFVFAVVTVLGIVLTIFDADHLTEANASRSWPEIQAVVVSAEVVGQRSIRPELTYRYAVADSVYLGQSDLRAPMFGGKRKKFDVARESIKGYRPGDLIPVRYNPENPAISTLTPGPGWSIYGRLGFAFTLVVVGLFGLSLPSKNTA